MSGPARLILVAGIVGALVAANMAMMPGAHRTLPPRPAPVDAEATALEWALFERTELNAGHGNIPFYDEDLTVYDGKRVSLFGYVSLHRDGYDAETQHVTRILVSPGVHFLCCGTGGSSPVTQLEPRTTVYVEHDAQPWTKPSTNPGLFVDAVGTLRLINREDNNASSDNEHVYRLEDATLTFYTLTDNETWTAAPQPAP